MFLFILESLGTSELLLIGIIALIFLGPRRLPEIAKKIGKMMAEFRSTANEFKSTWEREVDFEEEAKALQLDQIEGEVNDVKEHTIHREKESPAGLPSIRQIDPKYFDEAESENTASAADSNSGAPETVEPVMPVSPAETKSASEKRNWL